MMNFFSKSNKSNYKKMTSDPNCIIPGFIQKILKKIENVIFQLSILIIKHITKIKDVAPLGLIVINLLSTVILLILVLIAFIGSWFGWNFLSVIANKTSLDVWYYIYSIMYLIKTTFIFLAVVVALPHTIALYKTDSGSTRIDSILSLFANTLRSSMWLYLLLATFIGTAITKSLYKVSCEGKNPNPSKLISYWAINLMTSIMLFTFIVIFILRVLKCPTLISVHMPLFIMSLTFYIYLFISDIIENFVAYNLYKLLGMNSNEVLEAVDCKSGDENNAGFYKAMNIIISILIWPLIIFIVALQSIPLFGLPTLNKMFFKNVSKAMGIILKKFNL